MVTSPAHFEKSGEMVWRFLALSNCEETFAFAGKRNLLLRLNSSRSHLSGEHGADDRGLDLPPSAPVPLSVAMSASSKALLLLTEVALADIYRRRYELLHRTLLDTIPVWLEGRSSQSRSLALSVPARGIRGAGLCAFSQAVRARRRWSRPHRPGGEGCASA